MGRRQRQDVGAEHISVDQQQVEHTLGQGFRLLRFPPELERAFLLAQADQRTLTLVLAGLNAVLVFALILLTDMMIDPAHIWLDVGLRVGLFAPATLLLVFLLHRLARPQLNEWLVLPVALLAAGVIAYLAAVGRPEMAFPKTIELIIVVIYVAVFIRFWPMVVLSLLVAALHSQVAFSPHDIAHALRLGSTLLLLTTILFALNACYTRERNERLSFLLDLREQAMRASIREGNQRLADMARTDALTGVPNRRAFDDLLTQHFGQDGNHALALMLIDIDHFKAFNDRYGHHAGDRCLREVAQTVSSCLRRPVDMLARWGGEEFAVLLAEADEAIACQVAERICAAVVERALPHSGSPTHPCVTVSVGVALLQAGLSSPAAALLQAADAALYQAKTQGRHRHVIATWRPRAEPPC